jgi:recombination protein RecT
MDKWAKLLPAHVSAERVLRLIIGAVRDNPRLMEGGTSLYSAIIKGCQAGLEPDGMLGEAYLVPFGGEVKLVIGYKGYLKLARNTGEVANVQTSVVREGDSFDWAEGDEAFIKHKPAADANRNKQPLTHVYGIITLANGHKVRSVWDVARLVAHRDQYVKASGPDSPWQTATEQMYIKTVLISMLTGGLVPQSPELKKAIELDGSIDSTHADLFVNYVENTAREDQRIAQPAEPVEVEGDVIEAESEPSPRELAASGKQANQVDRDDSSAAGPDSPWHADPEDSLF